LWRLWLAACRARWLRLSPLAREIIVVLAVKTAVLAVIWFAFFRDPVAPGMWMEPEPVEQRFLSPSPARLGTHVRP
jgi:hypothetical protein